MTVKRNPLAVAPGCIEPPPRIAFRKTRSCVVLLALAMVLSANSRAASNADQPPGSPHWAGQALHDAARQAAWLDVSRARAGSHPGTSEVPRSRWLFGKLSISR